jgi:hypothetical protein
VRTWKAGDAPNEAAVRRAIFRELEEIAANEGTLADSKRAELAYAERLDSALKRASESVKEIEEFEKQMIGKCTLAEEEQELWKSRLFVLNQEYEELTEELRRLK